MADIHNVKLSEQAKRDLRTLPSCIARKFHLWTEAVIHQGLTQVRKIPGYHDEPLKGKRNGQRSIRLNIAYRAIYIVDKDDVINFVEILEVNKHNY